MEKRVKDVDKNKIIRCPTFGPRLSISERCGVSDIQGERNNDELGAFSGSCKVVKESLSDDIRKVKINPLICNELQKRGFIF